MHYERDYDNAFWDGTQLVFGDGDGQIFDRFTKPVDVLGHEFTHAVTEHTAGLVYQGQSGALNESVSDVFATCLKQRLLGQTADEGDWLIGEGCSCPASTARRCASMSAPGTAYDDPVLGKDPQPADMSGYIETTDDNGGVHLNSGIPNRAFHLAATAIGGSSAEGAGRIWYAALGAVAEDVDFAGFAAACVDAAGEHADAVRAAWTEVGVLGGAASGARAVPAPRRRPAGRRGAPLRRDHGPHRHGRRSTSTATTRGSARCATWSTGSTSPRSSPGRMHPDAFVYDFVVGAVHRSSAPTARRPPPAGRAAAQRRRCPGVPTARLGLTRSGCSVRRLVTNCRSARELCVGTNGIGSSGQRAVQRRRDVQLRAREDRAARSRPGGPAAPARCSRG